MTRPITNKKQIYFFNWLFEDGISWRITETPNARGGCVTAHIQLFRDFHWLLLIAKCEEVDTFAFSSAGL